LNLTSPIEIYPAAGVSNAQSTNPAHPNLIVQQGSNFFTDHFFGDPSNLAVPSSDNHNNLPAVLVAEQQQRTTATHSNKKNFVGSIGGTGQKSGRGVALNNSSAAGGTKSSKLIDGTEIGEMPRGQPRKGGRRPRETEVYT
jgi:hypothetical protein